MEIRSCYPWIPWFLWKTRNKFLFEGPEFKAGEIVDKAYDEASVWFAAQKLDKERETCDFEPELPHRRTWSKPSRNWRKCNYGITWSKKKKLLGATWIVRDHKGDTLLHSRRSFANVLYFKEAKMMALCWTLESMAYHNLDNVIIAGEDATLLKVIERPRAWPSFTSEYQSLRILLSRFSGWKNIVESRSSNRYAFFIAKSAQQVQWGQSYVARGASGGFLVIVVGV